MRKPNWLVLAASISIVGCAVPGTGDDGTGDDTTIGDDAPPPPPPEPAAAYHLTSDLDVSASTVLPGALYDAYDLMRTFEDSPGTAILDLAEMAGVPAVATLRAALPDFLESRLIGWIDDRLASTPLAAVVGEIVDLAETAFGEVELGSGLDVDAGVHELETIAVVVAGHRAELAVEPVPGNVIALSADVAITSTSSTLSIGEHRFGVRVGTAAWTALEAAIQARFGADLQGAIASAIDCPGLAAAIANKCVLGQCVGHQDDLLAACNGAVGYAVGQVRGEITGLDFDAVILHSGQATGADANHDGTLESLAGSWTAELDLGVGPRSVPATFTGTAE